MKKLTVIAAGLGYRLLERNGMLRLAGLRFEPAPSVFPAVTCVAQATLRTGLSPERHGMVSNGTWDGILRRPVFWEQNCRLVAGDRVWGESTGLFFLQQSLGEDVELVVSPAPIHKHGGGIVFSCYAKPPEIADALDRELGVFPLWRYWGPLASPKVGRACIDRFERAIAMHDVGEAYLYLSTLDYAAQKHGPDSPQAKAALAEFAKQAERIAGFCEKAGAALSVIGDYEIAAVDKEPFLPNAILREKGFFKVRHVGGRAYPDFFESTAFAVCDHEFCFLRGERAQEAEEALLASGGCEKCEFGLLAKRGSWCGYEWWTDRREAPDYANHVDIHNKPGFDPKELFFFNRGVVRGTHGRRCEVAYA